MGACGSDWRSGAPLLQARYNSSAELESQMSEEELRTIEFDEPVGSLVVDIPYWHDEGVGAGTGAFLWDGSIMLSQTLCTFHAAEGDQAKYQLGGRVVELGAG